MIPEKFSVLLHFNPVARIIIGARNSLLYNTIPSPRYQLITLTMVLLIFALGYAIFKGAESKFAEEI
jgi:ABC-type polysaccharide/polyol phosphate export permease